MSAKVDPFGWVRETLPTTQLKGSAALSIRVVVSVLRTRSAEFDERRTKGLVFQQPQLSSGVQESTLHNSSQVSLVVNRMLHKTACSVRFVRCK